VSRASRRTAVVAKWRAIPRLDGAFSPSRLTDSTLAHAIVANCHAIFTSYYHTHTNSTPGIDTDNTTNFTDTSTDATVGAIVSSIVSAIVSATVSYWLLTHVCCFVHHYHCCLQCHQHL
jgi:hypothetical protein